MDERRVMEMEMELVMEKVNVTETSHADGWQARSNGMNQALEARTEGVIMNERHRETGPRRRTARLTGVRMTAMAIMAAGLGVSAWAREARPAPDVPGHVAACTVRDGDCRWRLYRTVRACVSGAQSCPNGLCQTVESCRQAESVGSCPGIPSAVPLPGGSMCREDTACKSVLPLREIRLCTCQSGLFGCCLTDCIPTGALSGVMPCDGTFITLVDPPATTPPAGDPPISDPPGGAAPMIGGAP